MVVLVTYLLLHLCSSIYQSSTENQILTGDLCVQLEIAAFPKNQQGAHGRIPKYSL